MLDKSALSWMEHHGQISAAHVSKQLAKERHPQQAWSRTELVIRRGRMHLGAGSVGNAAVGP